MPLGVKQLQQQQQVLLGAMARLYLRIVEAVLVARPFSVVGAPFWPPIRICVMTFVF